jgi:hypothetical protein
MGTLVNIAPKASSKRVGVILALTLLLSSTNTGFAIHATAESKPTPKATKKSEVKKKPVKKKPVKKKVVKKPRKISKPLPSPSPKWPPRGFKKADNVYISTPKSEKELVGVLSAKTTLLSEIRACDKQVCAVIYVASAEKCKWWEVQSIVIGRYADVLGNLQTLAKGSKAREVKTIILVSKEPVEDYAEILNMKAFCRNDQVTGKIPSNRFTPNPELVPTPTPSPSPTPTLTLTPTLAPTPTSNPSLAAS